MKTQEAEAILEQYPNIVRGETLAAHHTDARGDRCLAVLLDGDYAGEIVDLVWQDVTLNEVRSFPGVIYVWVNGGWLTAGDDPTSYQPSIRRICERRPSCFVSSKSRAEEFRRLADMLDPQ